MERKRYSFKEIKKKKTSERERERERKIDFGDC
jgi:hypothetical protein